LTSMNTVRIIGNHVNARTRVHDTIRLRQSGLCRQCKQEIRKGDQIVSKGSHSLRYHYHLKCARRLLMIWLSSVFICY